MTAPTTTVAPRMTGGIQVIGYNAAGSSDKTLVYVEGASHGFSTYKACEVTAGQFGDTERTTLDYLARRLNNHTT